MRQILDGDEPLVGGGLEGVDARAVEDLLLLSGYKTGVTGNPAADVVSWGVRWSGNHLTYSTYDYDGSYGWSGWREAMLKKALACFSDVANVSFSAVYGGPEFFRSTADLNFTLSGYDLNILFNNFGEGAILALGIPPDTAMGDAFLKGLGASFGIVIPRSYYQHPEGDVFIDHFVSANTYTDPGQAGFHTLVHEIGHALGLKHPFDSMNGRSSAAGYGQPSWDSGYATVMSYNRTSTDVARGHQQTLMPLDILALQSLYGANMSHRTGNDSYALKDDWTVRTIWDAGGYDTLDASGAKAAANIDLTPGAGSTMGHSTVATAFGAWIEAAKGGSGDDTIRGNPFGNLLDGGGGNDVLYGGAGDFLVGGDGFDMAVFDDALYGGGAVGAGVRLDTGVTWGAAAGVSVQGIEGVTTGAGADVLIGSAGGNALQSGGGADTVYALEGDDLVNGGDGVDWLDGGAGTDTLSYEGASAAVGLRLDGQAGGGPASWGAAAGEGIAGFENATGTGFDDVLVGSDGANRLRGLAGADAIHALAGDDTLEGGDGADALYGGEGVDFASYADAAAGIGLRLDGQAGAASWGAAAGDRLDGIEGVIGSRYADTIVTPAGRFTVDGGGGDDTVYADALTWRMSAANWTAAGNDTLYVKDRAALRIAFDGDVAGWVTVGGVSLSAAKTALEVPSGFWRFGSGNSVMREGDTLWFDLNHDGYSSFGYDLGIRIAGMTRASFDPVNDWIVVG